MNIFEVLIVQPLFNMLMLLYVFIPGSDFGVSIIIFTILLRLIMYPLVKRQLHQTKAMRRIQPELELIKKRTKGNRQLQGVQMMELYKKHGVSPFRSIGIMVVQLPIFIAFYLVIRIFALHRNQLSDYTYGFLQHIGSIHHILLNPSAFNENLFGVVNLTQNAIGPHGVSVVLIALAVVAAIGQFIQSKQTLPTTGGSKSLREILSSAASGEKADQSEINGAIMGKMIYVLPFFMLFVMLSLPGAISLYYATTTIVAVIQQAYILREDEEELEEIADEPLKKFSKKATAKARAKVAEEATVTRIVAKGSRPSGFKKRSKGGSA